MVGENRSYPSMESTLERIGETSSRSRSYRYHVKDIDFKKENR